MATNNAINIQGPTPTFLATLSSGYITISGGGSEDVVPFDTTLFDTTSSFNTASHQYIVPETGTYVFVWQGFVGAIDNTNTFEYSRFNNIAKTSYFANQCNIYACSVYDPTHAWYQSSINSTLICSCTQGDAIDITYSVTGSANQLYATPTDVRTYFAGYMITQV